MEPRIGGPGPDHPAVGAHPGLHDLTLNAAKPGIVPAHGEGTVQRPLTLTVMDRVFLFVIVVALAVLIVGFGLFSQSLF